MKTLVQSLLFVLIIGGIAFLVNSGNGHVIIFVHKYRIDLSLVSGILCLVILFLVINLLLGIWHGFIHIPSGLNSWWQKRMLSKNSSNMHLAFIHYCAGKYNYVYKHASYLISHAKDSDDKLQALLFAYISLGYLGDVNKQNEIAKQLSKYNDKKRHTAILFVEGVNAYKLGNYGICIDLLSNLLKKERKHAHARYIMLKAYMQMDEYKNAYDMLTWLNKNNILSSVVSKRYYSQISKYIFTKATDVNEVEGVYSKLPKEMKKVESIAGAYLLALTRFNAYEQGVKLINSVQASSIYQESVTFVKRLTTKKLITTLLKVYTEEHINSNKNNHLLFLILGILYFNLDEYEKAKQHIKTSIALHASTDGYLYLCFIAKATDNIALHQYAEKNLLENVQGSLTA